MFLFSLVCELLHDGQEVLLVRQRNPRATPQRSTINIASAKLGGGAYFAFLLSSDNSHTTPTKIPPDEEGLLWATVGPK